MQLDEINTFINTFALRLQLTSQLINTYRTITENLTEREQSLALKLPKKKEDPE